MQKRHSLALFAAGAGVAVALCAAPTAAADPLLPGCEGMGGSAVSGGQTTDCASPGNSQLTATPNDLGVMGAEIDEPVWGGIGW